MTAVEPLPVREPARALWCAAAHPFDPAILCRKVRHDPKVLHSSDGQEHWPTPTEENDR